MARAKSTGSREEISNDGLKVMLVPGPLYALLEKEAQNLGISTQEYITLCLGYGVHHPEKIRSKYIKKNTGR